MFSTVFYSFYRKKLGCPAMLSSCVISFTEHFVIIHTIHLIIDHHPHILFLFIFLFLCFCFLKAKQTDEQSYKNLTAEGGYSSMYDG